MTVAMTTLTIYLLYETLSPESSRGSPLNDRDHTNKAAFYIDAKKLSLLNVPLKCSVILLRRGWMTRLSTETFHPLVANVHWTQFKAKKNSVDTIFTIINTTAIRPHLMLPFLLFEQSTLKKTGPLLCRAVACSGKPRQAGSLGELPPPERFEKIEGGHGP